PNSSPLRVESQKQTRKEPKEPDEKKKHKAFSSSRPPQATQHRLSLSLSSPTCCSSRLPRARPLTNSRTPAAGARRRRPLAAGETTPSYPSSRASSPSSRGGARGAFDDATIPGDEHRE
uniref:Uncharacterized protein n=1 Tax=Oryza barthii TaxID=65489 RepID=A0A0D3EXW3_9ORYZ